MIIEKWSMRGLRPKILTRTVFFGLIFLLIVSGLFLLARSQAGQVGFFFKELQAQGFNLGSWLGSFSASRQALIQDFETLKKENEFLKAQLVRDALVRQENAKLKALLDFKKEHSGWKAEGAQVLGVRLGILEQTFLIDRGLEAGIKTGQAVITGSGILIGQIQQVGSKFAKARLLTHLNSAVAVETLDSKVSGVATGTAKVLELKITDVNQARPKVGELVRTKSSQDIPAGLLVGTITEESKKDKVILISPIKELRGVEWVLVLARLQ
jgi:rod shape-determining protein MreC